MERRYPDGKTANEEAMASTQMLGGALLLSVAILIAAAWWLLG